MLRIADYSGGCWPTPGQELLLKAALLRGQPAIDAWQQWKSAADTENLDPGSYRMLPLTYRNLSALGAADPLLAEAKAAYRRTWLDNQLMFHRMGELLQALHAEGIETLLLKGAALVPLYYRDYGARPMADFDLLIQSADLPRAMRLLGRAGWLRRDAQDVPLDLLVTFQHALGFHRGDHEEFDLHWHLRRCSWDGADDDFWAGAVAARIGRVESRALNPSDELLHICLHGLDWNRVPPFRWAADAVTLLCAAGPEVDWERLVAQSRQRRLTLIVAAGLDYLARVLEAPVPPEALAALRSRPVTRSERMEYDLVTTHGSGALRYARALLVRYDRFAHRVSWWRKLAYFPRYLQYYYKVPHFRQVPGEMWALVWPRLLGRAPSQALTPPEPD